MVNAKSGAARGTTHLQFPEVRVVEASAGSGKTYALAMRYLQLLMRRDTRPEECGGILAITFTNAAAREMKERILDLLKKTALDLFSTRSEREGTLRLLPVKGAAAGEKARALADHLISNYNCFRVHTIDSFVNLLLSGCASELGLSANFSIRQDCAEYLAHSLDGCIDEANRNGGMAALFDDFLRQYLYIDEKSGWFPRSDILSTIEDLYLCCTRHGGNPAVSGAGGERLILAKRDLRALLERLRDGCPEGTDRRFLRSLGNFLAAPTAGVDVGKLTSVAYTRDEFPANKGCDVPPECRDLWKKVRAALSRVSRDEARAAFDCYIEIYHAAMRHFRERARRDDLVFLEELNLRAAELFGEGLVTVPEIYCRLASRFTHFLIDEFQDTSRLQWGNLVGMIEEALSRGGTLFYVGDKKQAIYRFRGGDAALFDEAARRLVDFNVRPDSLTENRRSRRQIIAFNNEVFSVENLIRFLRGLSPRGGPEGALDEGRIEAIAAAFRSSRQGGEGAPPGGYVKAEVVEFTDREERDDMLRTRLTRLVGSLTERFPPESIAVLTRENSEVELVTSWLLGGGVSVESEKTLSIRNNPFLKELVSFLEYLNSPIDDLAFASFILGEIFTSAAGIARDEIEGFILSARTRRRGEGGGYLYRGFRERYCAAWNEFIENFFVTVGVVPPYELAVGIMRRFSVFRRFPDSQGYFMRFLELIREQEEERPDLASFLAYFKCGAGDDLFVRPCRAGAVRVMTIHKAKGLQFPVVVAPFLGFSSGGRPPWTMTQQGKGIGLVRVDRKYARFSREVRSILTEERARSLADDLNVLYVACTRPRDELYLFIPCGTGRGDNPVKNMIPPAWAERGSPLRGGAERRKRAAAAELPPPEYGEGPSFPKEERLDPGLLGRREELRRGEVLHCILSRIGALAGGDGERALAAAAAHARLRFPFAQGIDGCVAQVRGILENGRLRPFFFVDKGEVFTEKEIVDREGRGRRIDRLVLSGGEAWVIDYKSAGRDDDAYRAQVREYARMIGEALPGVGVRGFLIFLDEARCEEVG